MCACVCVCMSAVLLTASAWAPKRKEPTGRSVLTQAPVNPLFSLFLIPTSLSLSLCGKKESESGQSSKDVAG